MQALLITGHGKTRKLDRL